MLGSHGSNQFIVLLETPGAEPFVDGVLRIAGTPSPDRRSLQPRRAIHRSGFEKETHR